MQQISLLERVAFAWGHQVGRYSLHALRPERMIVTGRQYLDLKPCILAGWHRTNLVALAFHRQVLRSPSFTFVASGLAGAGVRGWMTVFQQTVAQLPDEHIGNPQAAVKQMARALRSGVDVVIALDGPHGPPERCRPGALWLARLTERPIIPTGFAAWPSFNYPRWDRHIIPLPGARLSVVFGEPMTMRPDDLVDEAHLVAMAERVTAANRAAHEQLQRALEKPAAAPEACTANPDQASSPQ